MGCGELSRVGAGLGLQEDLEGKTLHHVFCPSVSSSIFRQVEYNEKSIENNRKHGEKCFVKSICKWGRDSVTRHKSDDVKDGAEVLEYAPASIVC